MKENEKKKIIYIVNNLENENEEIFNLFYTATLFLFLNEKDMTLIH